MNDDTIVVGNEYHVVRDMDDMIWDNICLERSMWEGKVVKVVGLYNTGSVITPGGGRESVCKWHMLTREDARLGRDYSCWLPSYALEQTCMFP